MTFIMTLLKQGKLKAHPFSVSQEVLDSYIAIEYICEWFDDKIPEQLGGQPKIKPTSPADRILLLLSTTGSGKSTILMSELFHWFFKRTNKNLGITQPRVMTAMEIPRDIVKYNNAEALKKYGKTHLTPIEMGKTIGYNTGSFKQPPLRGIVFMTSGTLQQQFNSMTDEYMRNKYAFIVLDECHETSNDMMILLYSAKQFIYRNYMHADCPFIILATGTFDPFRYADYMLDGVPKPDRYKNIIQVEGTSSPIVDKWLTYDSSNWLESLTKVVIDIHANYYHEYDKNVPKKLIEDALQYSKKIKDGGAEGDPVCDFLVFIAGKEKMFIEPMIKRLTQRINLFSQYPIKTLSLTEA